MTGRQVCGPTAASSPAAQRLGPRRSVDACAESRAVDAARRVGAALCSVAHKLRAPRGLIASGSDAHPQQQRRSSSLPCPLPPTTQKKTDQPFSFRLSERISNRIARFRGMKAPAMKQLSKADTAFEQSVLRCTLNSSLLTVIPYFGVLRVVHEHCCSCPDRTMLLAAREAQGRNLLN